MSLSINNTTKRTVVAHSAEKADTYSLRMRGLLGRDSLASGEALIITQCQSIHMFFMRFPIDVIFVDRFNKVVGMVAGIQPNTLSPVFWKANYAIELSVGSIENSRTAVGDELEIKEK